MTEPPEAAKRAIAAGFMLVQPDRTGLLESTRLAEAGLLRPQIARTFPLEGAAEAHHLARTSAGTPGKIVLTVT
ncbi:zinc-binding dehydrogenase [Streptacidiphilus rugosus]|uniref:zinc-binding dehydrogenase n=1 Tax=Streptacidiphilus rugosus TaxID=405783 RepID=UPI000565FEE7|nr:zinc-binding dehydrogenase [Streptacidiphilus rugosus]